MPSTEHLAVAGKGGVLAGAAVFASPLLRRTVAPLVFGILFGCSTARYTTEPGAPSLVLPARIGEGSEQPGKVPPAPPASATPAASASAAPAAPPPAPSTLPDPTPLKLAEQVEYELELNEGKVAVVSVKAVKLKEPIVTPRMMGRYAIELGIGQELIERLRFDFPGTAADEPMVGPKKLKAPLDLGSRAIARVKLMVPQSPRVRRALLVDRALNTATELEWPLPAPPPPAPQLPAAR